MSASITSPLYIILAFALYSVVHSISAGLGFKAWLFNRLGQRLERYYRLLYSIFAILTLLPIFVMPLLLPDTELWTIPTPWRYLTGLLQLLAVLGLSYSVLQTGALTFVGVAQALAVDNAEESLNTKGLYQYMRHPLYTFSMIFIWLTPTMTANWFALYASFSAYFVIGAIYEERKLVKIFGDEYSAYQAETPMFLPHPFK